MILTGTNLGERHHEINRKVNEAVERAPDFGQMEHTSEALDVENIFKIDLASKCKNIDFLVKILKSGDNFLITRVLKCTWMYDDEYSHVINVNYLVQHVFPFMSQKMQRKLLTNIANNLSNKKRAEDFYSYCYKHNLYHNATKFLLHTSEDFKLNTITQADKLDLLNENVLPFLIGNSFKLADAYLKDNINRASKNDFLYALSYLYSVSNEDYLDLLEKFSYTGKIFGLRFSKNIIKNHKGRVLNNLRFYIPILNQSILVKNSTCEEIGGYLKALLPENVKDFWNKTFLSEYKTIIKALPDGEKFKFMKEIYSDKYSGQAFEMRQDFYSQQGYEIMTKEEREVWATEHLDNPDNDIVYYYKFLPFDKAFERMKKQILITTNSVTRNDILQSVVETAKTKEEIQKFLEYYYDRHSNENHKDSFISHVTETHSILDFEEDCFNVFNKLIRSAKICYSDYNEIVLVYSILNNKDYTKDGFETSFEKMANSDYRLRNLKDLTTNLDTARKEILYKKLRNLSLDLIESNLKETDNDYDSKKYIKFYLNLIKFFEKPLSEIPENVMQFIKNNKDNFSEYELFGKELLMSNKLMRFLKTDAKLACDFESIEKKLKNKHYIDEENRLTSLFRKLRVYFHNDIAQEYLKYFQQWVNATDNYNHKTLHDTAVYATFQLADEHYKLDFLKKHEPVNLKINEVEMDQSLLTTQIAICRYAYYSRPSLPLPNILAYVKGDYVQYCLPMFNYFVANLTPSLCSQFLEALINSPVKTQKHGLRLAFQCFNVDQLKKLVVKVWSKNKNISLRAILYTSVFQHVQNQDGDQSELFDILRTMTLGLHKDDDPKVFRVMGNMLPEHLRADYLEAAWKAVSELPLQSYDYKRTILDRMSENISLMNKEFLLPIIEDHIRDVLMEQRNFNEESVESAKWELVTKYILKVNDERNKNLTKTILQKCLEKWYILKVNDERNKNLTKTILQKCLEKWNEVEDDVFTMRQLCHDFINRLVDNNCDERESYARVNPIFESILQDLLNVLPVEEVYLIFWELKLTIIVNKVADFGVAKMRGLEDKINEVLIEVSNIFAKEIGALVSDLVNRGIYHVSFAEEIAEKIKKNIRYLLLMFKIYEQKDTFKMHLLICESLTTLNMAEVYLLVAKILPVECDDGFEDEYRKILEKIKSHHNSEVRCYVYQKFMNNGFKRRKYY